MITPPYLQKGDKIGIVCTARKISPEELFAGLKKLESWGLQPVLGKHLYKEHLIFAGSDEERTEDLQQMLDDKEIKAILFARGGYGTIRIVDNLDFTNFLQMPKWVAGYSDITTLHSHINKLGVETIHSVMLSAFKPEKNDIAADTLRKALFGELQQYEFPRDPTFPFREGESEGELIGGNLSLLYALSGSISDLETKGKILFVEDIEEYLYHIDRMMHQLKRAGKLQDLEGLLVGGMTDMKDNPEPFGKSPADIIWETVKDRSFPVAMGFPSGHILNNHALIMGRKVKFSVNSQTINLFFNGRT